MRVMVAVIAAALAGCSGQDAAEQATAPAPEATAAADAGVVREEIAPAPTPTPAPMVAAIQTQPGPRGYQAALTRATVTGDILTIALAFTGGKCCAHPDVDEISLIDDATSQRIGVLKDNSGKWMAGPMSISKRQLNIGNGSGDAPTQVFLKFPAPPATSKTVSLTIPEVAPFDAVPVTR
jgi:glucose/arabinose dehydrogenase